MAGKVLNVKVFSPLILHNGLCMRIAAQIPTNLYFTLSAKFKDLSARNGT